MDNRNLELISEFENEEGKISVYFSKKERQVYLYLDNEENSKQKISQEYESDIIRQTLKFESKFWKNQKRTLNEIYYNLDKIEIKLKQWPYIREER